MSPADEQSDMLWKCQAFSYIFRFKSFFSRYITTAISSDMAKIVEPTTQNLREVVPRLSFSLHKGQSGRIGVIGGSKE